MDVDTGEPFVPLDFLSPVFLSWCPVTHGPHTSVDSYPVGSPPCQFVSSLPLSQVESSITHYTYAVSTMTIPPTYTPLKILSHQRKSNIKTSVPVDAQPPVVFPMYVHFLFGL